jgi:hypothetical protein
MPTPCIYAVTLGLSAIVTGRVRGKPLGDPNADLTYTPVVPCRILDTRIIGGPLQPDMARIFEGYAPNFAVQGGASSDCGIPASVPVLALNVYAVNPRNTGFIKVWAFGTGEPAVSTVNSQVGITAIATGTLVPVVWISTPPRLGQVDAGRKLHRGTQSRRCATAR